MFQRVEKGHSFFKFIEAYCFEEKQASLINRPLHRLCSLVRKMGVKTAVIEELPPSYKNVDTECQALETRYETALEFVIFRITFVRETVDDIERLMGLNDAAFLATATLINYKNPDGLWQSYLFSSIVREPKIFDDPKFGTLPLLNNYLHIRKTFHCMVELGGVVKEFSITGSFFCQQNKVTSVCAHAALCMTLNNMSLSTSLMFYPESVNAIIGVNHTSRKLGPNDVSKEDTQKVLEQVGLTIDYRDFDANPEPINYRDFVYQHIESRSPVLLVFSIADRISHVVPVLGHTLNPDVWTPEAVPAYLNAGPPSRLEDYYSSVRAWVDHFIIHDDNFGMYFCLPADALKQATVGDSISGHSAEMLRVWLAVGVIPAGVTTPGWEAEAACALMTINIFQHFHNEGTILDEWNKRILSSVNATPSRQLLIRTFLEERGEYMKSLDVDDFESHVFSGAEKEELMRDLPERFWLCEVTLPQLYTANKSKLIDFYYGCNYPTVEEDYNVLAERWIQIRLPTVLYRRTSGPVPLSVTSHYPLFRFNSEAGGIEW